MIIDCKEIRVAEIAKLEKEDLEGCKVAFIQVGENDASKIYVRNKINLCEVLGIEVEHIQLHENTGQNELINIVQQLNSDCSIHGIMVQLPLPRHIKEEIVIEAITPVKDIDGFTAVNKGKLMVGDETGLVPCTPQGIMTILEHQNVDVEGKEVVIVGRSNIVGKPLAQLLINKGATVTVCNSKTRKDFMKEQITYSDIFISAIGQANYFDEEYFDESLVDVLPKYVIDVGINRDEDGKLCGDISKNVYDYFDHITPVPSGVGLLTVVSVIKNIVKCYKLQK